MEPNEKKFLQINEHSIIEVELTREVDPKYWLVRATKGKMPFLQRHRTGYDRTPYTITHEKNLTDNPVIFKQDRWICKECRQDLVYEYIEYGTTYSPEGNPEPAIKRKYYCPVCKKEYEIEGNIPF